MFTHILTTIAHHLSTYTHFPYTTLFRSRTTGRQRGESSDDDNCPQFPDHCFGLLPKVNCVTLATIVPPDCRLFTRNDSRGLRHRSEEHTSELQSLAYLVCRLLLEKKKTN